MANERRRFNELFGRLIDAILNRLFDLRPQVATFRLWAIILLFLFSGFVISLFYYPLPVWLGHIQDIFGYLLNPDYIPNFPGDPFYNLASYAYTAFTDPRVLQYLPIFLAPFFIALHAAANYLADVFELDDPRVARQFVWAVALWGSNKSIRISNGTVLEGDRSSPVFLIGGPGSVMVDMDSAALFERPDGIPRVIPSDGNPASRKIRLDGFERFRQAVDLRPHLVELRAEDGRLSEIRGRSLDGIPISATDVCFQFTVYRDGQFPNPGNPYPFLQNAIQGLVYRASSTVRPDLQNPSLFEANWPGNLMGMVRATLGRFMNDHKLVEYLASIGLPEVDRFNERANELTGAVEELTHPNDTDVATVETQDKPTFFPRDQLKFLLFNMYAEEFTRTQRENGVELFWVGIGTWRPPIEIFPATGTIPDQHIEAWRLSNDNLKKQQKISKGIFRAEAIVQEFSTLIQEIPVARPLSASTPAESTEAMRELLNAYRLQLIQAVEFMRAKRRSVPEIIVQAIDCLNDVLGESWQRPDDIDPENNCPPSYGFESKPPRTPQPGLPSPGIPTPFAPSPIEESPERQRNEEHLFTELVILVHGDTDVANRLIEQQERLFPKENRRKWIERARDKLLHDRGAFTP
jgi:hypothetical protein